MVRIKNKDGIGADYFGRENDRGSRPLLQVRDSRLAFTPQPLVERFDGVAEVHRSVASAIVFEKLQLVNEAERRRIEVQAVVDTGGSAEQDPAHVALSPR